MFVLNYFYQSMNFEDDIYTVECSGHRMLTDKEIQQIYKDMDGAELLQELLYYGVSGIDLSTTGSNRNGIRACSSNIKPHHYAMLEERLKLFNENHK